MNGFVKFTACCLALGAGCRATDRLTSWSHKDELSNVAASEQLSARIEKNSPGLQSQAAQNQPTQSLDERIRSGREEVSNYYADMQSSDPAVRERAVLHLTPARLQFEAALAMAPQNSSAHHGLAIIADLQKNYPVAEQHYQQALIQKPTDSDILGDMGFSYLLQNRLSESEQYSLRAVQANPSNDNAMKHLGDAYARQGKSQLAMEAYAKVYSPEEVNRALAENAPAKKPAEPVVKTNSSLFDRLVPGKSHGEKLAADIEKRHQAYEDEVQRHAPTNPRPQAPPGSSQVRLAHEAALRQQLTAIDHEGAAKYQSGPIMVDDQTGQMTRLPGAENHQNWQQGGMAATNFGPMNLQAPQQASPQLSDLQGRYAQAPAQIPQQNSPYFSNPPRDSEYRTNPGQYYPQPAINQAYPRAESSEFAGQNPQGNQAPARQQYPQRSPNVMQQPWNGIQQTGGMSAERAGNSVNHAYQQIPQGQPQNVVMANGQAQPAASQQGYQGIAGNPYSPASTNGNSSGMMSPAGQNSAYGNAGGNGGQFNPGMNAGGVQSQPGQPQSGQAMAGQGNSYDQASKAAARMGMGMGPGDMVFNQPQSINPPGSMTYESTNTPAPQRWMPDEGTPQNLNDAYQPYPNPVRPPAYTQGGQMPPSVYPSYSKEQFGTASQYDTRTMRNSDIPQDYNNSMQGYENQRWVAGREANMAVEQIWNQGPINSPMSPSTGSQYTFPNQQGMMYTPNTAGPDGQGLVPEQWPNQPVANPGDIRQAQDQPRIMYQGSQMSSAAGMNDPNMAVRPANDQFGQGINNQFNVDRQYDNNQYNSGVTNMPQNNRNLSGAVPSTSRNNVVIPSDYRMSTRAQAGSPNGNGVTPAGGSDNTSWPTIIPAAR